jgi:dTDP-glucose pyrophosphorylase
MNIATLCITPDMTILEAMKQIDANVGHALYITEGKKLFAALTDGDIRRHLLKGGQLSDKVASAANFSPKYVHTDEISKANAIMLKGDHSSLPVVNQNLEIQDILFQHKYIAKKDPINAPVVIMAGGKGVRLHPYTKVLPKPLIPIGDLSISEHIMNRFAEFGCNDFHYIVNHKKQLIKAYFSEEATDYKITFYDEATLLGTGGGLCLLKGHIKETFFLSNCDSILKADYHDIYRYHKEQKNIITMVCVYKHFTIPYGVVSMGENGDLLEIQEKPEYSFLTNTGFYIVEPDVIDEIESNVPIGFPEIVDRLRKKGGKTGIYPVSEMSWLDMGQLDELENMRKKLEYGE